MATQAMQDKTRYEANKEKILAQKKIYYAANRDKVKTAHKKHYEANKESIIMNEGQERGKLLLRSFS